MAHVTTDSDNNRYATDEYEFGAGVPLSMDDNGRLCIEAGATITRLADDILLIGVES